VQPKHVAFYIAMMVCCVYTVCLVVTDTHNA